MAVAGRRARSSKHRGAIAAQSRRIGVMLLRYPLDPPSPEEVARAMAEFFARGGTVTQCAPGGGPIEQVAAKGGRR
jgi:hypothetical protein